MEEEAINARCDECGTDVPADAPLGLCPACLLKRAMAATTAGAGRGPAGGWHGGFDPPAVADLVPLFPQLEILEFIGRGGMGAVYKARQIHLDRFVAVKILPATIGDDPAFAERFAREARSLAKLNHPNIVTVHDFGRADPYFFFVMEYVDGANLRQAIVAKSLEPKQALAIVPQICDALQYAHDEGIVHRDIKPENVLLDKKGRVKIADFGLAKLLQKTPQNYTLTQTHVTMGTPQYMAPEQTERPLEVDHRADIYSLGVVFYEMLTGELPLGRFAAPSLKAQIDARLDEVVFKTLEKEPQRRYQQASEVKTGLAEVADHPQGGHPPGGRSRWWRGGGKPPTPVVPYERAPRYARTALAGAAWAVIGLTSPLLLLAGYLLVGQSSARIVTAPPRPVQTAVTTPGGYGGGGRTPGAPTAPVAPNPLSSTARGGSGGGGTSARGGNPLSARAGGGGGRTIQQAQVVPPGRFDENPEMIDTEALIEAAENDTLASAGTPWATQTIPSRGGSASARAVVTAAPAKRSFWSTFNGPMQLATFPLLAVAFTAPFGATILGLIAITQIRQSSGRLYGMPLAIFDTLVFPLLLLDALIIGGLTATGMSLVSRYISGDLADAVVPVVTVLSILAAIATDVWIVRRVRGAVNTAPATA